MATESDQVKALQQSILARARELADEHIAQGDMTRNKILEDAHEKIRLMEQKELLAARVHADREYHRLIQANELRVQAELDRNRWGLVQAVMDKLRRQLDALHKDEKRYQPIFRALLKQAADSIGHPALIASINNDDLSRYHDSWQAIVQECCGDAVEIKLSPEACGCSGGLKLGSEQGDVMIDNTFEGILLRREPELQRLIFERLFSTLSTKGSLFDG